MFWNLIVNNIIMSEVIQKFIKDSEIKSFDLEHRKKIKFNISKYDNAVLNGKERYRDLELAKKRVAVLKNKVLNNLDKYLIEFSSNFEERGGKIIWAQNQKEAVKEILSILKKHKAKKVVKSKSMTTEEIEINYALEKNNIESLETDLGEYIVQVAGEKPYHIVTPAMQNYLTKNLEHQKKVSLKILQNLLEKNCEKVS